MSSRPQPEPPPDRPSPVERPAVVRALVAVVGFEVLLLLAAAAYLVVGLVAEEATELGAAVAQVPFALALAAGLAVCGRGLWRCRRWSRAPLVVWQAMQLAVGVPQFTGGALWAGLLLCVPAVAVLVGLFSRPAQEALDPEG